jgi:hypothetical protein
MSSKNRDATVVLVSMLLTVSAFALFASNTPTPQVKVDRNQALSLLGKSANTNPWILGGTVTLAELRYVQLDFTKSTPSTGEGYHDRIFAAETDPSKYGPYWFIEYENLSSFMSRGSGRYIVDAQTGDVLFSLEASSGGVVIFHGLDYQLSSKPEGILWIDDSVFLLGDDAHFFNVTGNFTPLIITVTANDYYDAALPVSMKVIAPRFYTVSQNVTSGILRKDRSVSFLLQISPIAEAFSFNTQQKTDQLPYLTIETFFLGQTSSYKVYLRNSMFGS